MIRTLIILSLLTSVCAAQPQPKPSERYEDIVLDPSYEHLKWGISPSDTLYRFAAYTTSFDTDDDNNGNGTPDIWGIPEWVAYEIKKESSDPPEGSDRPSPWLTDSDLHAQGIAPDDRTYHVAGTRDLKIVKGDYRYVRGHMCPKDAADRLSAEAGFNTHTVLNAVPQLQWQNNGVWKDLEIKCTSWADSHQRLWVVCGPAFFGKTPAVWLGQNDEVKAAVPDAIYKIVIREDPESETGITTLAFLFPNVVPKEKRDIAEFLTTIDQVEAVTGLSFLTTLDSAQQAQEKRRHGSLTLAQARAAINGWGVD